MALNDTLQQMELMDIFTAFHPKVAEYTFFSNGHGIIPRMYHILGCKTSLNKFKKIEISSIFSDQNAMKLEINHKNTEKHKNICGSTMRLRKKSKDTLKQMKMRTQ